ncbi:hypothetical protein P4641_20360 [Halalkalibacterium halodurans]|uniref:hypothetical protein n=1 Tax=Halalkalibacterium halodurans TaxID=86665 RepID=UPI002E1BE32A|nr:hypothetical protein [Halalkalibacterium halodurans]
MEKQDWTRFFTEVEVEEGKKVDSIDFSFVAEGFDGEIHVTDFQLQGGEQVTGTVPHISEILAHKYCVLDETAVIHTVADPKEVRGQQPQVFEGVKNRFYNIMGRGHEAITIPNIFETRFDQPTVTTVLDLTLKPKNHFDLLRISSNYGTRLEGWGIYENDDSHPLNVRYSREFWIEGGRAGDEIRLFGSTGEATKNGQPLDRRARTIEIAGASIPIKRQDFMSAPYGSFRVRIEFYTIVDDILRDTGVGYHGLAELIQWEFGRSKL